MMYITKADILAAYSQAVLNGVGAGYPPEGRDFIIDRACKMASAEINVHISARYPLPLLEPIPPIIQSLAIDIAVYKLATIGTGLTEEKRKRYEDASRILRDIATGRTSLEISSPPDGSDETGSTVADPPPVIVKGPPRVFRCGDRT